MNPKYVQKFSYLKGGYLRFDGTWKKVSASLSDFLGYSESELLSIKLSHISHPDDHGIIKDVVANSEKDHFEFDQRFIHKDGNVLWAKVNALLVRDEFGDPDFLAVFLTDITKYRDSNEQLNRQLEFIQHFLTWHHLVEDHPLPILISADRVIKYVNKACLKLYGIDEKDQIIGQSLIDFIDFKSTEKTKEWIEKIEQEEYGSVSEQIEMKRNGEKLLFEVQSIPIKYEQEKACQTVFYDITRLKKREDEIAESLKEKDVLLKEIHHRIKNNMAIISGLLELQALNISDNRLRGLLKQSQLRISSMAMIHEKLYQTESFTDLEFNDYIRELVTAIKNTVDEPTKNISVAFDMQPVTLNIEKAIPAALIINELVVNSYKHAFQNGQGGHITIRLTQDGDQIEILVSDNGVGLPEEFEIETQDSLGMNLIQTLRKQLKAKMSIQSANGTRFAISFKRENE